VKVDEANVPRWMMDLICAGVRFTRDKSGRATFEILEGSTGADYLRVKSFVDDNNAAIADVLAAWLEIDWKRLVAYREAVGRGFYNEGTEPESAKKEAHGG
jgi:hypothetical protein